MSEQTLRIGPAHIMTAPTMDTAPGDWVNLGKTRGDVLLSFESGNLAFPRTDQTGVARLASTVMFIGQNVNIQAPLLDHQVDILKKLFPASLKITASARDTIGFGSGVSVITEQAFAIVPVEDYQTLGESGWDEGEFNIWLPKGVAQVTGQFTMSLPEGEDSLETTAYETTFHSLFEDGKTLFSLGYKSVVDTQ